MADTLRTEQDALIDREALAGFPAEQARLTELLIVRDYYERRGLQHVPRRPDESVADYQARPKRSFGIARRAIEILCSRLYSPGPSRAVRDDGPTDQWLQTVYRDCLANLVLREADQLAHAFGVAAIRVDPTGKPLKPLNLQLWGYDQLILYADPDDATKINHVVTVDRFDERTRYTWYSDRFIRVYLTKKLARTQTAGGRTAEYLPAESGENPYGALPFAFVHYALPTNSHVSGGIGAYLSDLNGTIDAEASALLSAVDKYHAPKGFAYNVAADQPYYDKPGEFTRVLGSTNADGRDNPRHEYLQAALDIDGGWTNIRQAIDTALETLGVPQTLYRMNQATLPSGAAQVAEQQPLADYTEARRELAKRWETELAEAMCLVGGWLTGRADLWAAGTGGLNLTVTWPAAEIQTPGPERDAQDQAALDMGTESLAMIVKRRHRLDGEQEAWDHLERVQADNRRYAELRAEPEPEPAPTEPEPTEPDGEPAFQPRLINA